MDPAKQTEQVDSIKEKREKLENNSVIIQEQIANSNLNKGEIAFFDEKGNRFRSKKAGGRITFTDENGDEIASTKVREDNTLIIPKHTKRIVANCDLDITGVNTNKILGIYADGNITGKNVYIPNSEIRATGNVEITGIPNLNSFHVIVVSGGDAKLNGFKYTDVVSGGSKEVYRNSSETSNPIQVDTYTSKISKGRYNPRSLAEKAVER